MYLNRSHSHFLYKDKKNFSFFQIFLKLFSKNPSDISDFFYKDKYFFSNYQIFFFTFLKNHLGKYKYMSFLKCFTKIQKIFK